MKSNTNQPILFFDGVCNLCNSSVQFVLKKDKTKTIKFASLQSDYAREYLGKLNNLPDSIVFVSEGEIYTESTAALKLIPFLSAPYKMLLIFWIFPKKFRDIIYRYIARNRYKWFGQKDECFLPSSEYKERFLK